MLSIIIRADGRLEININGTSDSKSHTDVMLAYISFVHISGKASLPPASWPPLGGVKGGDGAQDFADFWQDPATSCLIPTPRPPDSHSLLWGCADSSLCAPPPCDLAAWGLFGPSSHPSSPRIKSSHGSAHTPILQPLTPLQCLLKLIVWSSITPSYPQILPKVLFTFLL